MDEPTAVLTPQESTTLMKFIRDYAAKGNSVVFITHNIEEAVYLAERVLILTNKPAKIREEVVVDLPRPRDVTDPKFIEIRNHITEQIKWW